MSEENKPTPNHGTFLAKAIRERSITEGFKEHDYPAMGEAIGESQDQVLFGVTPEWQEWAKDAKDRTAFSEAVKASASQLGVNTEGSEFTKHRMILGPVPMWDNPSCRPVILTSCAPNLLTNQADNKRFISEDSHLLFEEYYKARYRQAYAQLSLSKQAGKTDYYRLHEAGFGIGFPPSLQQDKPTALYLTLCAYKKAAEDIGGITVHSILYEGDTSAAVKKAGLEEDFPKEGALKFEVGTMQEAMNKHWSEQAVFENSGSDLSVGGHWWNLEANGVEQNIARDYALIETQSTTLNPNLKELHGLSSKNSVVIDPPKAGPMPKLEQSESKDKKTKTPPIQPTSSSSSSSSTSQSTSTDSDLKSTHSDSSPSEVKTPDHQNLLRGMLRSKVSDKLYKNYQEMSTALETCRPQVSLAVTPEWRTWAQTVPDPTIFSQALRLNIGGRQMRPSTTVGKEFTKHRMILGPVPKWDKPSCQPFILTSCAPNLRDEGGDRKQFIDGKGRVDLQKYYEARYHQAYAQLSLSKTAGKAHYYRSHFSGLGAFFPRGLDQDREAAIYLTSYAYRKAAQDVGGMTVHSILWSGNEKDGKVQKGAEADKLKLEGEFPSDGPLKFEVGSLQEAMEKHWDSKEGAVFENAGSDFSVGNTCLGNTDGLVEQTLAMEYALVETHSTTLNATLRDSHDKAKKHENCLIAPPPAGDMPELPSSYQGKSQNKGGSSATQPSQTIPIPPPSNLDSPDSKPNSLVNTRRRNSLPGPTFFPQSPTGQVSTDQQNQPLSWGKIFVGALIIECVLVAIPLMVAGFAELAKKTQYAPNFDAADVKDFFFGSPEANFATGLGLTIAILILVGIAGKAIQRSNCCPEVDEDYQSQP